LHEPAFRAFARPGELKEASVLDLGTNFDSVDSGGHSLSTPYQFEHDLAGDSWRFYLQGSGFEWKAPSSGSTQFGFTDSTVIAMHPVLGDGKPWKLFAGASVTVPTHGQVGSTSAIEAGRLVLKDNLDDRWSVKLVGAEGYVNSVSRGAGNVASYVHGELHYVTTPKEDVYVALERQVQSGAGGASNAIVVYDFLFSKPLGKLTGGSIALTRGLTSQTRDKSAEFDLEWTF